MLVRSGAHKQRVRKRRLFTRRVLGRTVLAPSISNHLVCSELTLRPYCMANIRLAQLAVPAVCLLVASLSYGSQILFHYIDPGPLASKQKYTFNSLVLCIWITYARAVFTSAGQVTKEWLKDQSGENGEARHVRQRYCRKCEALKPPRAHHCKVCQTYAHYGERYR